MYVKVHVYSHKHTQSVFTYTHTHTYEHTHTHTQVLLRQARAVSACCGGLHAGTCHTLAYCRVWHTLGMMKSIAYTSMTFTDLVRAVVDYTQVYVMH